jgi:hypothetical protein
LKICRTKMPHLHAAVRIYADGGPMKDYLEAAILTVADGPTIGDFLGMPEAVAAAYEKLFFAVREVMGSPGLILSVIRPAVLQGTTGGDGGVMKLVAYFLGWDTFRTYATVGTLPGAQQRKLEGIIRSELTKAGVASALSGTPARNRKVGHSLDAFGGGSTTCGRTEEQIEEHDLAVQIVENLEFHKASTGPPPIGSVEPRAIEGIQLREEASPAPSQEQPDDGDRKETSEEGAE